MERTDTLDSYVSESNFSGMSRSLTEDCWEGESARVFALLIGINAYKSGGIWNLESCVDDANRMRRWLRHDLHVARENICMLTDSKATKANIEEKFTSHLINNPRIQRGDAIIIYFAGHGSSFVTPLEWRHKYPSETVEVLCTYDHDSKDGVDGRIAGISVKAMQGMISDLYESKGDNITLILDCCSSPLREGLNRGVTRWTPTLKATTDDLKSQFYHRKAGKHFEKGVGFYQAGCPMHIMLAACGPGEQALEAKDGGRFTSALLQATKQIALHRTRYTDLIDHVIETLRRDNMSPQCTGHNRERIVFAGVPFAPDPRYIPVNFIDSLVRLEVGTDQGIVAGNHVSLHRHNFRASFNPPVDSLHILEAHDTYSTARRRGHELEASEQEQEAYWALVNRKKRQKSLQRNIINRLSALF